MKDCYSTAVKGAQDYNRKFAEFASANTEAAFEFVQELSNVKSPSEFFELSTSHSRKQLETLQLSRPTRRALAQKYGDSAWDPSDGRHRGIRPALVS